MFEFTDAGFDAAVRSHFGPLAEEAGLMLRPLRSGIHELSGPEFAVRIRRGTGHTRDFLVTLLRRSARTDNLDDLAGEIGLGNVALFRGQPFPEREPSSLADWNAALAEAARSTKELLVPYLLGQASDHPQLVTFVDGQVHAERLTWPQWPQK